ncbi:hypothetical protein NDN42_06165, partial [Limosilactobacillus mucosae]|uniref:hypothetical protein n=1 Tax=Limosilactobacillus mucosae TaxID=97478 RepID=UPI0029BB1161
YLAKQRDASFFRVFFNPYHYGVLTIIAQKCAGRPLLFYSLIFEIAHCLADNTVQYGVLTFNF